MSFPVPGSYPPFVENYIRLVHTDSVSEAIDRYATGIVRFVRNIPADKIDYSYAEGKWTIKEMLQHMVDAERVFAYRALRIARHDKTPLPGFDEKTFAEASNAAARTWDSIVEEFEAVRKSTDLLLRSFTEDQLSQTGTTSDHTNTVNAICFTVYGHLLHHVNLLKERYL